MFLKLNPFFHCYRRTVKILDNISFLLVLCQKHDSLGLLLAVSLFSHLKFLRPILYTDIKLVPAAVYSVAWTHQQKTDRTHFGTDIHLVTFGCCLQPTYLAQDTHRGRDGKGRFEVISPTSSFAHLCLLYQTSTEPKQGPKLAAPPGSVAHVHAQPEPGPISSPSFNKSWQACVSIRIACTRNREPVTMSHSKWKHTQSFNFT